MALNDITFIKGAGGLGRPLADEDHISGLLFWFTDANLPTGFSLTDRNKQVFSIEDAESLGIIEGSVNHSILWYHINEYFRIQPQGKLFIGLYGGVSGTVAYTDLKTLQIFADGKIRQMGIYDGGTTFATGNVSTIQVSASVMETDHMPLNIIYAADISGVADLSTLADLRPLNSKNVSVTIGEDGANVGAALAVSEGQSVTDLGAILGAVSLSKVNESIEFIGKFNFTSGTEFNVPAFSNSDLVKDKQTSFLSSLKDKSYIFLRKHTGLAGTFHENSATSISTTNDFATIENNRTIDKATRGVRTFMLPNLASPVVVNADGSLTEATIARFKNDSDRALEQMERDVEISAFKTIINPLQDVLSTSKLVINIQIVPVGIAGQFEINLCFTKISS